VLKRIGVLVLIVAAFATMLSGCKAKRSHFRADNAPVESQRLA